MARTEYACRSYAPEYAVPGGMMGASTTKVSPYTGTTTGGRVTVALKGKEAVANLPKPSLTQTTRR